MHYREHFAEELEGAIYIPQLGNSSPVASLSKTTLKHQNYFQVLLDSEKVLSKYLEVFFKSELGKLSLESLTKGSVIGRKAKPDLLDLALPIPDLSTQELLVTTYEKIEQLRQSVTSFESELSLNPNSATLIQESLDSVLQSLGKLSEEDQLLSLIRGGESGTLEFKQTFTKDVETGIKEKEKNIRKSSLKNVVGFLNSNGGTLIIGVKDDRTIVGIEADYFENDDKYLLNFKNQIKEKIGERSYIYLKWRIVSVQGKKVLVVECESASEPFFLEDKEFYVRTNPSVDRLEGSKLASYWQQRFGNTQHGQPQDQ